MEMLNPNQSHADKCGIYRVVAAQLMPAKQGSSKNDYIRLSLKKVMKSGRLQLGFSHYFNLGIKEYVDAYKAAGVTDKGISNENLESLRVAYEKGDTDARYEYYGFWWTQPFGATYRNKETGKISSETLVFIPCDEDTGMALRDFTMTATRLAKILKDYELVKPEVSEPAPEESAETEEEEEDMRKAFEEWKKSQSNG